MSKKTHLSLIRSVTLEINICCISVPFFLDKLFIYICIHEASVMLPKLAKTYDLIKNSLVYLFFTLRLFGVSLNTRRHINLTNQTPYIAFGTLYAS